VRSQSAVFERWSSEDRNVALAVSRLPSTLRTVRSALVKVNQLGREIPPGIGAMRPVVRQLHRTNLQVRPFAREATPILRDRVRPFVRAARPFIRDVRPAAQNLARGAPDLREVFFELNRFFNMAAYNPRGREPTSNPNRDEGMLFWVGWVAQNSVNVFSLGDAAGPMRRIALMATCSTFRRLRTEEPAAELILGVQDLLDDASLCPPE
jgi:phospholipid/cholesterol/gamma-HCH transport system substrate-binding protein